MQSTETSPQTLATSQNLKSMNASLKYLQEGVEPREILGIQYDVLTGRAKRPSEMKDAAS